MGGTPGDVTVPAGLLGTKLHAPRRRRGLVDRPRLLDRLTGPGGHRPVLALVSAPAGFGKTTLLASWLADEPRVAWLSLDPGDDEPVRFWTYVVAALRTADPAIGDAAAGLVAAGPASIDAALAALLNDLDAAPAPVALVLDDYHVIASPDIHRQVTFLLDHLPPSAQVVIATRSDPPLPLARLRAAGDLAEVRVADLRFTVAEAAEYLNGPMGLGLSSADIATLDERTEGWIAALQLAALSMRDRDDASAFIGGFAGDDRFVVDYLVEEVLTRQPDEVRAFLLQTSILERLTGPLCDAVTGRTDGTAVLETLDRANLFLVPLDDRRRWYRYHHLFGSVLQARFLDEHPDGVAEAHRRASGWFDAEGDRSAAISHAMRGGDHERAAELIERAGPHLRRTRQEVAMRAWLEALPDEVVVHRPVLTEMLLGSRMATGDAEGAAPLVAQLEAWLATDDRRRAVVVDEVELARLPGQVAIYRAALSLLAGDLPDAAAHADRARSLFGPGDHLGRGSAAALVGLARWADGDLRAAAASYSDAVSSLTSAGHVSDALGCSLALADIELARGRLTAAEATLEAGLRLAAERPGLRGTADMHVALSEVLLERDDLAGAVAHLDTARSLGEHAGLPQHPYRWRVAAARLRSAEGASDAALVLLAEAEQVYDTDFSPSVRPVPAVAARLRIAAGELVAADRWAETSGVSVGDEPSYRREYELVTFVRLLLARSDPAALGLIDRLLDAATSGGRVRSTIELLVLRARALEATDDRAAAVAALGEALDLADAEGYRRVFADEGSALATLLRPGSRSASSGLVDELSPRELDVLRLLRSELGGPDIARELLVSLNTMRTHTKSIYAKLGVTNRREAVRRADELGL